MSYKKLVEMLGQSRSAQQLTISRALVKPWWPKPTIRAIPEKYWGTKQSNVGSDGLLHKYKCSSFSRIGFYTSKKNAPCLPSFECLAYGETPQQAYSQWCLIFKAWNQEEDWI